MSIRHDAAPHRDSALTFSGFAPPTSNTVYCPNQFFDVCLPHCSRGCVRVVSYMLRKTLGWCDEHGLPLQERFTITYRELQQHASISRDMINAALAEAVERRFIRCLQVPRSKGAGHPAVSGLYELRWDDSGKYVKDPREFRGFFAGEGNRTYIPNQFFDVVIRDESLAVAKVVGAVVRFSIGFVTKWGHRRQQVPLSYDAIARYVRIRSRTTVTSAIAESIEKNFIVRVEEGRFDPNGGVASRSAVYALRWLNPAVDQTIGRKSVPALAAEHARSENRTGIGPKTGPAERSEKCTDIQITTGNNTLKQQPDQTIAVSFEELCRIGFDPATARYLAVRHPIERILNQIEWLDRRHARKNRLGLLRRAIEQDWVAPGKRAESSLPGELGRPNLPALSEAKAQLARRFRLPFTS